MKDYYRLLAFFNNTETAAERTDPNKPSSIQFRGPTMAWANPERDRQRAEVERQRQVLEEKLSDRRRELDRGLASWVTRLDEQLAKTPRTHVLEMTHFESRGTTDTFEILSDGAVLLRGGDPPETNVYTIQVRADLRRVGALRLEALRHEALPGGGPGRGDPKHRNFVLTDGHGRIVRELLA